MDGSWDQITLYGAHRCAGGVANIDGRLTCNHGLHVGSSESDRWQGDGYRRGYERDYGYDGGYDRWHGYSGSSGHELTGDKSESSNAPAISVAAAIGALGALVKQAPKFWPVCEPPHSEQLGSAAMI
jgi:hypothetical protein